MNIASKNLLINDEIHAKEVRVVGDDGSQLGIMGLKEALDTAQAQNLDLVNIAPQATPPVCRIMDYGKFRFEQSKKEKEQRKNQKVVTVKEIRLSVNIDTHDFETKAGHATKFLQAGDKVKALLKFRGREMAHTSLGAETLKRFGEVLSEYGTVERNPKLEGRTMSIMINPKESVVKK